MGVAAGPPPLHWLCEPSLRDCGVCAQASSSKNLDQAESLQAFSFYKSHCQIPLFRLFANVSYLPVFQAVSLETGSLGAVVSHPVIVTQKKPEGLAVGPVIP